MCIHVYCPNCSFSVAQMLLVCIFSIYPTLVGSNPSVDIPLFTPNIYVCRPSFTDFSNFLEWMLQIFLSAPPTLGLGQLSLESISHSHQLWSRRIWDTWSSPCAGLNPADEITFFLQKMDVSCQRCGNSWHERWWFFSAWHGLGLGSLFSSVSVMIAFLHNTILEVRYTLSQRNLEVSLDSMYLCLLCTSLNAFFFRKR